jgi:hypothetical protein
VPIRPLQLYADGGYQLRIRRLEGTPNYGPRQRVNRRNLKFTNFKHALCSGLVLEILWSAEYSSHCNELLNQC